MSDKTSFRETSGNDLAGEFDAADEPAAAVSACRCDRDARTIYGPMPKPVARPNIFAAIGGGSQSSERLSPSFKLAESDAPAMDSESDAIAHQAFPSKATVAVQSQAEGPSLDELVDIDASEASREELVVYHGELMGWIRELEQALQNCQMDFKAHLQLYAQQEQLLERRTQALLALEKRYGEMSQEIDTQQRAHQRQTILVETLQGQLDSSQERVAQMERDFSQVQQRCSEQAQQRLQAEGLCRDLKSRLGRQQRHTMQFKAALEKSLAVSVSDSDYDLGDIDLEGMDSSGELFPKPKPVQPWSNPLDENALTQALNGLDEAVGHESQSQPGIDPPTVAKGLNLQLAFEDPEAVDAMAAQVKAAAKAQMAYGPLCEHLWSG